MNNGKDLLFQYNFGEKEYEWNNGEKYQRTKNKSSKDTVNFTWIQDKEHRIVEIVISNKDSLFLRYVDTFLQLIILEGKEKLTFDIVKE